MYCKKSKDLSKDHRQVEIQEAGLEEALDGDDLHVTNHVQQSCCLDDDMVAVGQLFIGSEGGDVGFGVKVAATRDILASCG